MKIKVLSFLDFCNTKFSLGHIKCTHSAAHAVLSYRPMGLKVTFGKNLNIKTK